MKRIKSVLKYEAYCFFHDKKFTILAILALFFSFVTTFATASVFSLSFSSDTTFEEIEPYYEEQRDIYYYGYMLTSNQITIDDVPNEIRYPVFPLEINPDYETAYFDEYTKYQYLIDNEIVLGIDVLNYANYLSPMDNYLSENYNSNRTNNLVSFRAMQFTLFSFISISVLSMLLSFKMFISNKEKRVQKNVFMSSVSKSDAFLGKYILYSLISTLISLIFFISSIIIVSNNINVGLLLKTFLGWKSVSIISILFSKYILFLLAMLALPHILIFIENKTKNRNYLPFIFTVGAYFASYLLYLLVNVFILENLYSSLGARIDTNTFILFPIINIQYEWYGFYGFQFYMLALILFIFSGSIIYRRIKGRKNSIQ